MHAVERCNLPDGRLVVNIVAQPRIAVVGAGNTGASFAYTLLLSGLNPEIMFVDPDGGKAEEQALDLQQATIFFEPHEVRAGSMTELPQAAITVFCGVQPESGETSQQLLEKNIDLLREATLEIAGRNPSGIILVGAAPVDLMTYATWKLSGLPRKQVIGTGTIAETATLRCLLGRHFRVDSHSIHAYVVGGNGGKLPVWSSATLAGMYITDVCRAHGCPPLVLNSIFSEVRDRTANPGIHPEATNLSTGAGLARIATAILRNENHVFSVSTVLDKEYGLSETATSVPAVIGEKGIDRILRIELNDEEVAQLLAGGAKTRKAISELNLREFRRLLSEVG
jgi:L-lactate dehydrogenase